MTKYFYHFTGGKRYLIPEGPSYLSNHAAGTPSIVSPSIADQLPAGQPLADNPVTFRLTSGAVYLYTSTGYHYVPTGDVLSCWALTGGLNVPYFGLAYDSAIEAATNAPVLDCSVRSGSTSHLLNGNQRIAVPTNTGFTVGSTDASLVSLSERLPLRNSPLGTAVQANSSPVVWYLENGQKKGIPSLFDLQLLGITLQNIDRISPGAVNSLPGAGIKFGLGQVVRASDTSTIYVITSHNSKRWIGTSDDFNGYGYNWNSLLSFPSSVLDQDYTTDANQLSRYLYTDSGGVYLMDPHACYGISSGQLTAFGTPSTPTPAIQNYNASIFPYVNLSRCTHSSIYIKNPASSAIYILEGGQKRIATTWSRLVEHSGVSNPYIINVSNTVINSFPTGNPY